MHKANILDIQNHSKIIDYGVLQHFYENELLKLTDKPFIFHLAGQVWPTRYIHSLDYIKKNNI